MSSTAFIASRRRSNARAPLTTGFHPLGTKYIGNSTVKTGCRFSSVTFTVHRRKSGAQSAKEENIITRFIRRTAMECAAARSLTSLPIVIWEILIGSGQMKVKSRHVRASPKRMMFRQRTECSKRRSTLCLTLMLRAQECLAAWRCWRRYAGLRRGVSRLVAKMTPLAH
jgi:hypothetical protein